MLKIPVSEALLSGLESGTRQKALFAVNGEFAARGGHDNPAGMFPSVSPDGVRSYPRLGFVELNVDREQLANLLKEPSFIRAVHPVPTFRFMQNEIGMPGCIALDPNGTAPGIEALGVTTLWDEGLHGDGVIVGHVDTGIFRGNSALPDSAIAHFASLDHYDCAAEDQMEDLSSWHGTHTAGIIAGRPVGVTKIGVAYGARLASAIIGNGEGVGNSGSRLLRAFEWAICKGARVINMSVEVSGDASDFAPVIAAVRYKNVLPVCASGNSRENTSFIPGNLPDVLSVGSCNRYGQVLIDSSSQDMGRAEDPIVPDLVAPGDSIVSACGNGDGWNMSTGTSMSAAHISGLAALLIGACPAATAGQVEAAIIASCNRAAGQRPARVNHGMPNAQRALDNLRHMLAP